MMDTIAGGLFGVLIGDALGAPYEERPDLIGSDGLPTWRGGGAHGQPAGTWSDDGAMTLCQAESLLKMGRFDAEDSGQLFLKWLDEGHRAVEGVVFDVGCLVNASLSRVRSGVPAEMAGGAEDSHNGNGSLMRSLPIALWYAAAPIGSFVDVSRAASAVTHAHPRTLMAVSYYNLVARRLLRGDGFETALSWAKVDLFLYYLGRRSLWKELTSEWRKVFVATFRKGGGYVIDTLWTAVAALRAGTTFESTLQQAVAMGGDTDTTGAITGGLAGIIYGLEDIPETWMAGLRISLSDSQLMTDFSAAVRQRILRTAVNASR